MSAESQLLGLFPLGAGLNVTGTQAYQVPAYEGLDVPIPSYDSALQLGKPGLIDF